MGYRSRVYRQRNPHSQDESSKETFFGKQHSTEKQNGKGSFFQAKLTINKAGDPFEKEADSVANKIVGSKNEQVVQPKDISSVQRSEAPAGEKQKVQKARERKREEVQTQPEGDADREREENVQQKTEAVKEEEEKPVQKKEAMKEEEKKPIQKKDEPLKEEEKPLQKMDDRLNEEETPAGIQQKPESQDHETPPVLFRKLQQAENKGMTLSPKVLKEMNDSFGADFSKVRIHSDNEAAEMNKALRSQAFAHGKDIYFNHGKYNPDTADGKRLLAHELTHTIQQTGKERSHKNSSQTRREEETEETLLNDTPKQHDQ